MSIQPSGKHRSSGRSRRQWLGLSRLLAVAVLVGAGLYVALRQPIPTPAGAPAAYTGQQATDAPATDPCRHPRSRPRRRRTSPRPAPTPARRPPHPPSRPRAPPRPTAPVVSTTAKPASTPCQPVWFALSDLGIDTGVVRLGLTTAGDLGTPRDADKKRAGWFPSVRRARPAGPSSWTAIRTTTTRRSSPCRSSARSAPRW